MKVVELFAGVGGFRLGFEAASKSFFKTIWANQWEPSRKTQHAADCYKKNFGDKAFLVCQDIAIAKKDVPDHDLLCGGFPCQDYSVASTKAKGIEGKKGVLWWEIRDIVESKRPKILFLENVDRLLKSPAKQKGRDFGIILRCLDDLGYAVEWRVIDASDYGHPQKRRRTLIIGYEKTSDYYKKIKGIEFDNIITKNSILSHAFKVKTLSNIKKFDISSKIYKDLVCLTNKFNAEFGNAGFMDNSIVCTGKVKAFYKGHITTLKEILDKDVDDKYFIRGEILSKWKYLKGAKRELRYKPNGEPYYYTEGAIPFPDNLNTPARTMLTSESSVNRSSHIILDPEKNEYRILTPEECEKINEFPVGWTNTGMPQKFRYFVMGNALVVGLFEAVGKSIKNFLED